MPATPTFGRYAELTLDEMSAEQREAYHYLMNGPRGRLPGPYKVWVHNPKLVHAADPLGRHFTEGNYSLTEREREIAVVVTTAKWNSDYPAAAHEKRGRDVGLPAAAVEAMTAGLPASFEDPREHVVYEMAISLVNNRLISQGLHDRAIALLGHPGISDVITLIGYYTAVSLTMNFYAVPAGTPGIAR